MVYDPMRDILDNIDKQMAENGITAKDVTPQKIQNGSKKCMICGIPISSGDVCVPCYEKHIAKNPRKENLEKGFTSQGSASTHDVRGQKKKLDSLDKYLIFTFTSLIIYTIVSQILFYVYQIEMAVLTGCFFAAFGGEILMCALIKKLKLHKEAEIKKDDGDSFT